MMSLSKHPSLRITYKPGHNKILVVSFAGRGGQKDNFKRPVNEFYRLASGNDENHALFVQDTSNSWMNGGGIAEAICETLDTLRSELELKRIVTLGNSMGGTMALLMAQVYAVDAAIAIAPQFSVDPRIVPDDTRWMVDREKISHFRFPDVSKVPFERTRTTVLHGAQNEDGKHALLFPKHKDLTHFIFPDYGHNLASALHRVGDLEPIVSYAIAMRPRRTRQALAAAGGVRRMRFEGKR